MPATKVQTVWVAGGKAYPTLDEAAKHGPQVVRHDAIVESDRAWLLVLPEPIAFARATAVSHVPTQHDEEFDDFMDLGDED